METGDVVFRLISDGARASFSRDAPKRNPRSEFLFKRFFGRRWMRQGVDGRRPGVLMFFIIIIGRFAH